MHGTELTGESILIDLLGNTESQTTTWKTHT